MAGDGLVINQHVGVIHQLLAATHVARMAYQRMNEPKLGYRQRHLFAFPVDFHPFHRQFQLTAFQPFFLAAVSRQRLDAPEQRDHARNQVRQRDVLGQVVVRTKAETGNNVKIGIARGQKNNRQATGQCA